MKGADFIIKNNNKKGIAILNALVISVIVMTVVFIMTSFISTNAVQIARQEMNVQAKILSVSGVELATSALLSVPAKYKNSVIKYNLIETFGFEAIDPNGLVVRPDGANRNIYTKANALTATTYEDSMGGNNLPTKMAKIEIFIYKDDEYASEDNATKAINENVIIESIGTITRNNKEVSLTSKVKINIHDPVVSEMKISNN